MLGEQETFVTPVVRGLSSFFGGAFTYLLYRKVKGLEINKMLASCIEVILFVSVIFVVMNSFEQRELVAKFVFYLTVLMFSLEAGFLSNVLKKPVFLDSGRLSYSIYMTHSAMLYCLSMIAVALQQVTGFEVAPMVDGQRYITLGRPYLNNLVVFVILGIVIFISNYTYKFIEIKGQEIGRR